MNDKYLLLSALILSIGIIIGCYLIASTTDSSASSEKAQSNHLEQNKVLINMNEAADLLGLSIDGINSIIGAEKTSLETSGSFRGMMFPYLLIDGNYYFEKTKLLVWAQESATEHRIYNNYQLIR